MKNSVFLIGFLLSSSMVIGQINCPPNLPLTLNGNTQYCVGTNGAELSVAESYDQYEWLPTTESGQSVLLTAGNYNLVVTHYTGCTDTISIEVEQVSNPPQPTIDASGPTEFCEGESVTLSGPAGYAYYEWNSGSVGQNITVYESGTFVLSIEDLLGCVSSSNSMQVIVNVYPTAAFSPSVDMFDVSFNNLSLDANSYEWNFGDGATSTDFEPNHSYTLEGNLDMYLVAENDCGTDTAFLNLSSVSTDDKESVSEFRLFPNPSSGITYLNFNSESSTTAVLEIHDQSGRLWLTETFETTFGTNQLEFDLTNVSSGSYISTLNLEGEKHHSRLSVIQ